MDELIYLLIKLIADLFGGGQIGQKGPGYPKLPPRSPPLTPQQKENIRAKKGLPPQKRPPQAAQRPKPMAVKKAAPRPVQLPAPPPVAMVAARSSPPPVKAAPTAHRPAVVVINAAALGRWLKPPILHNQYILCEIFQPPLALRQQRWT